MVPDVAPERVSQRSRADAEPRWCSVSPHPGIRSAAAPVYKPQIQMRCVLRHLFPSAGAVMRAHVDSYCDSPHSSCEGGCRC